VYASITRKEKFSDQNENYQNDQNMSDREYTVYIFIYIINVHCFH